MPDRQLKKKLEKGGPPAYDPQKLEETIIRAKKLEKHPEKLRMTNAEFFFSQLRFIRKKTWLLKICFSIGMLCILAAEEIDAESWTWTLLALTGSVLCLINTNEIYGVFQAGMVEIQMAAKHSFCEVLMARLAVFGFFDLAFFACAAVVMQAFRGTAVWQVILYGIVPYAVMCFGCIHILNRCREEDILLYSGAWGICLSCIFVMLKIYGTAIFDVRYFGVWAAAGAAAAGGAAWELKKLLKRVGGNVNEINYGTAL